MNALIIPLYLFNRACLHPAMRGSLRSLHRRRPVYAKATPRLAGRRNFASATLRRQKHQSLRDAINAYA